MARVGAVEQARYLLQAVLDILTETGFAERTDSGWKRRQQLSPVRSTDTHDRARQACPEASPTFELIERCRAAAGGFVTGRTRGLAAIFPRADVTLWERVYNEDRVMSIYADLVASALHAVGRPGMRVLEVGGGVGSVLARCATRLDGAGVGEYWFTDVGRTFVDAARHRHVATPWLRFAQLDIDRRLEHQGFRSGTFDVVVGVNVAHVARDLGYSLLELRGALRPGGCLILGEGSPPNRHDRWRLDVVFAFLRGWWDVAVDGLRPRPGFMLPSEWARALKACGYGPVSLIPGEEWFADSCRGGLILAHAP
jgi:SAM-dependent methyltransferase